MRSTRCGRRTVSLALPDKFPRMQETKKIVMARKCGPPSWKRRMFDRKWLLAYPWAFSRLELGGPHLRAMTAFVKAAWGIHKPRSRETYPRRRLLDFGALLRPKPIFFANSERWAA